MDNDNRNIHINNNFEVILTIVFIVLKLTGVINWSWVWVLAPLWIDFIIVIIATIIIILLTKNK